MSLKLIFSLFSKEGCGCEISMRSLAVFVFFFLDYWCHSILVFTCYWYQSILVLGCSGWCTASVFVFIVSIKK